MRRAFLYAGVKLGILTKNMTYQYRKNLSTADRENQLPVISRNDLYKLNWLRSVYKKTIFDDKLQRTSGHLQP
jgi:hypothetical protein